MVELHGLGAVQRGSIVRKVIVPDNAFRVPTELIQPGQVGGAPGLLVFAAQRPPAQQALPVGTQFQIPEGEGGHRGSIPQKTSINPAGPNRMAQ